MVKGRRLQDMRCLMCSKGPHKNEKLHKRERERDHGCYDILHLTYLPRLHRLPSVKRAANFRDLTKIMGDRANAWGNIQRERGGHNWLLLTQLFFLTRPKQRSPSSRQVKKPMIRSFLLYMYSRESIQSKLVTFTLFTHLPAPKWHTCHPSP